MGWLKCLLWPFPGSGRKNSSEGQWAGRSGQPLACLLPVAIISIDLMDRPNLETALG